MRIKVNPDLLDTSAKQLQSACTELMAIAGKLSSALSSLDAESQQLTTLRPQMEQASKLGSVSVGRGNELAKLLTTKAALFRQIDQQGSQGIGNVLQIPNYSGVDPAKGTTSTSRGWPITAPLTSNTSTRDPRLYDEVLDQFAVPKNPRYTPTSSSTFCNIFAWDATKAMGAEIPHWVDSKGNPTKVAAPGSHELSANGVADWLRTTGNKQGWRAVSLEEGQKMANSGHPVVASWKNPAANGIGHVAMVRPNDGSGSTMVAQAGAINSNSIDIKKAFSTAWKNKQLVVYVHD